MGFDRVIACLPQDFLFGVATSSYQIEGTRHGGCGPSHWDDFAALPGRVSDGADGALACDHYHRFASDLDLVSDGGFGAYRFSFSWPRLLPETDTAVNPDGVAFYDRLLDAMLERGLQPFATLYHWDLPRRHAVSGGWQNRDTCGRFADYTDLVMRNFGDRLYAVAPVNEPWCVSWLSHYWGHHAPGLTDLAATARSMHYIQLAHGRSVEVLRGHGHRNVGCVLNKEFAVPFDGSALAAEKTQLFDGIYNRWFEESIFKGRYPRDVLDLFGDHMPDGYEDDLALIAAPLDWVGSNYYTRSVIQPDGDEPHIGSDASAAIFRKLIWDGKLILVASVSSCAGWQANTPLACRNMLPRTVWRMMIARGRMAALPIHNASPISRVILRRSVGLLPMVCPSTAISLGHCLTITNGRSAIASGLALCMSITIRWRERPRTVISSGVRL